MIVNKFSYLLGVLVPLLIAGCASMDRASNEGEYIAGTDTGNRRGVFFNPGDGLLPDHVVEITREQIQSYLPDQDFDNVPLLDPTIDWRKFENRPDQYKFQGETYYLSLVDVTGRDYIVELWSRNQIAAGMGFIAKYRQQQIKNQGSLNPSCHWGKSGFVISKHLRFGGYELFGYQFHRSGRLLCFTRDDFDTKEHIIEYFDRSGNLVGKRIYTNGANGSSYYEWNGKETYEAMFNKRKMRLLEKG